MTATRSTFTEAEQAYYNTLDEAVTTGRVERVGPASHRDGSPVNPDELDEILRGRPALGHDRATGAGRSPRRQVRLPADTNAALTSAAIAWLQWIASEPPRRIAALPDFRHNAAASAVTFGRAS